MGVPENVPLRSRGPLLRRVAIVLAVIALLALVVFALSRLELSRAAMRWSRPPWDGSHWRCC